MKAAELFVRCLEEEGVKYVFGVPGEENADFLTLAWAIRRAASTMSSVGLTDRTGLETYLPIGLDTGSCRSETQRMTMSRSVTMPLIAFSSVTIKHPTPSRAIVDAASATVAFSGTVTTTSDMASCTRIVVTPQTLADGGMSVVAGGTSPLVTPGTISVPRDRETDVTPTQGRVPFA